MSKYEVRELDGAQIVRDTEADIYYFPLDTYAKQAGLDIKTATEKARQAIENQHISDDPSIYQVQDLGSVEIKGVNSRYLIPAQMVFTWLLSDCRMKALLIGCEAMDATAREMFQAVGEPIKQGKKVRLKEGVKPVQVLEFHRHHEHLKREDLGTVLEYPNPRLYAGYPDDDAILLVKKWGRREPLKVRVNIKDLELMED